MKQTQAQISRFFHKPQWNEGSKVLKACEILANKALILRVLSSSGMSALQPGGAPLNLQAALAQATLFQLNHTLTLLSTSIFRDFLTVDV